MADTAANRQFLAVWDCGEGELVYDIRVESVSPAESDEPAVETRLSPHPVARWSVDHDFSALVAVSGGKTILGLTEGPRATVVVHDVVTRTTSPGPRLRDAMVQPAMLPVGNDTVIVMGTVLRAGRRCFVALRRLPGGGSGWRADPLPNPPAAEQPRGYSSEPCVVAYFAMGGRAWISLNRGLGTFSLDTEHGTWRVEGSWALPVMERRRALFVPELGSVVMGLTISSGDCSNHGSNCYHLCALDVEARPPVVRHVWEFPVESMKDVPHGEVVSLAHLGNGRFCISRSVTVELSKVRGTSCKGKGTSFTLVEVTRLPGGELRLARCGKVHTHVWPHSHSGHADFI